MTDLHDLSGTQIVRRNGQLMSCEPCRRSKMRCDHGRPYCERCTRRGQESQCFYHPAPMTRRPRGSTDRTVSLESDSQTRHIDMINDDTAMILDHDETDLGTSTVAVASMVQIQGINHDRLGAHSQLPDLTKDQHTGDNEHISRRGSTTSAHVELRVDQSVGFAQPIAEGARLLAFIMDTPKSLGGHMLRWLEKLGNDCPGGPLAIGAWQACNDFVSEHASPPNTNKALSGLSTAIFERTKQLPVWLQASTSDLQAMLKGEALRWETIGLYCALCGLYLASAADRTDCLFDGISNWGGARRSALRRALMASVDCGKLCEEAGQLNDLSLWLVIMTTMLTRQCYGDASNQTWRMVGELLSILPILSPQNMLQETARMPLYIREFRKHGIVIAYELDQSISTFAGRPPRLASRYHSLDLPLDLPYPALMGSVEALSMSRRELGDNGWHQGDPECQISRMRATLLLARMRESVLHLVMGPKSGGLVIQTQHLIDQLTLTWDNLPVSLHFRPALWASLPARTVLALLRIRLDYHFSERLLHKLAREQANDSRRKYLELSQQILSLVTTALNRKFDMTTERSLLESLLVFYAIPSADALVVECLQLLEEGQQPLGINVALLVRDLGTLISQCVWIAVPDIGNHAICVESQVRFARDLDRMLELSVFIVKKPVHAQSTTVPLQPLETRSEPRNDMLNFETNGFNGQDWMDSAYVPPMEFWTNTSASLLANGSNYAA